MEIENFRHKGLRLLYEDGSSKGVPAVAAEKLRNMFFVLDSLETPEELKGLSAWKPHQLSGTRKGSWSFHVTRNWRLTFRIDTGRQTICDVDLEDYH